MNAEVKNDSQVKRFVDCAVLEELALNNLSLSVVRERAHDKGKLSLNFNVDTALKSVDENTFYQATAVCTIVGKSLDDEQIFDLKIEYFLSYRCSEVHDWPEEEMDYFANKNVIIHLWPYMRESVDQMTRRASLNRVILPLLPTGIVPKNSE